MVAAFIEVVTIFAQTVSTRVVVRFLVILVLWACHEDAREIECREYDVDIHRPDTNETVDVVAT